MQNGQTIEKSVSLPQPAPVQIQASGSLSSLANGSLQHPPATGSEDPLSVADVADLLHPQYAIITGGRSKDGCPLITFPDHNNFQSLADHDYQKLILYLTSVPS